MPTAVRPERIEKIAPQPRIESAREAADATDAPASFEEVLKELRARPQDQDGRAAKIDENLQVSQEEPLAQLVDQVEPQQATVTIESPLTEQIGTIEEFLPTSMTIDVASEPVEEFALPQSSDEIPAELAPGVQNQPTSGLPSTGATEPPPVTVELEQAPAGPAQSLRIVPLQEALPLDENGEGVDVDDSTDVRQPPRFSLKTPGEPESKAPAPERSGLVARVTAPATSTDSDSGQTSSQPQLKSNSQQRPSEPAVERDAGLAAEPVKVVANVTGPAGTSSSPIATTPVDGSLTSPMKLGPQPNVEPPAPATAPTPREIEFASNNHERLVTTIRTQLLPKGGSMQIRLDPPQLGTLQVSVRMQDGVMSISFQTSNEAATTMLSHSLTQLKHVLESRGLAVDKLHVQQAPRDQESSRQDPNQQQRDPTQGDHSARQEQHRREMLQRMWRRLALGNDPLDLVA